MLNNYLAEEVCYMDKGIKFAVLFVLLSFVVISGAFCEAANNPMVSPADQAIAEYTAAITANPRDFVAYNSRGLMYMKKKLFDEAAADFTKAIEINPNFAAAYYSRGGISFTRQKYDAAIDDYTQAIKMDATFAGAYTSRAFAYIQKEQYDLAIADSSKAIELSPRMTGGLAYFAKGQAHFNKHQYDEALTNFRALIANYKDQIIIDLANGYIRRMGGSI